MTAQSRGLPPDPVLLFDGDCGLCTRSVQFVSSRDREGVFRFAPLGSPTGQAVLDLLPPGDVGDTIVLLAGGRAWVRSDAVVQILKRLPGWRGPALLLRIVPRPLRDLGYRMVARVRRRFFPPPLACPLPDPDIRARVLQG